MPRDREKLRENVRRWGSVNPGKVRENNRKRKMTQEEANHAVTTYRTEFPEVKQFWDDCETAVLHVLTTGRETSFRFRGLIMAWRDDIADRARNGGVEGVLKIYDDLEEDRQRVRAMNAGYLAEIGKLAGMKSDKRAPAAGTDSLDALARAHREAVGARKAATARKVPYDL